jgi:hypothetical protein
MHPESASVSIDPFGIQNLAIRGQGHPLAPRVQATSRPMAQDITAR